MTRKTCPLLVLLTLALAASVSVEAAFASSPKRSKADEDINAIGHRKIWRGSNFYLPQKEVEKGKALSVQLERSAKLVTDPAVTGYVTRLAQSIAQNSDADMPIVVRVIDSDQVNACTLPGGYQYFTRGLLLKLGSEGELAGVLARGIAHTALRTATKALTNAIMMQIASPDLVAPTTTAAFVCISNPAVLGLAERRQDELDADYFGVQYVYKSGYAPESFVEFTQSMWGGPSPTKASSLAEAFSPFPPLPERLKDLQKEIAQLLPSRGVAVLSTSEFEEFHMRLRASKPEEPTARQTSMPTLIRHAAAPQ